MYEKLPEYKKSLKEIEKKIAELESHKRIFEECIRVAEQITEVVGEGVDKVYLHVGKYFMYRVNYPKTHYAHYHSHPEDVEMKPHKMRWVVELIHDPPKAEDDFRNLRTIEHKIICKNNKEAIEVAKEWVIDEKI
jgi:hypothetical protein